jgi:hypothetical protein
LVSMRVRTKSQILLAIMCVRRTFASGGWLVLREGELLS